MDITVSVTPQTTLGVGSTKDGVTAVSVTRGGSDTTLERNVEDSDT